MKFKGLAALIVFALFSSQIPAANVVPPEIEQPGTQPNEVGNFESPDRCDNCHAGYNLDDPEAEPATGWLGPGWESGLRTGPGTESGWISTKPRDWRNQ